MKTLTLVPLVCPQCGSPIPIDALVNSVGSHNLTCQACSVTSKLVINEDSKSAAPAPYKAEKNYVEKSTGMLPLVLEIKPNQAAEGLVGVFKPNEYCEQNVDSLARTILENPDLNDLERGIVSDIERNLRNGELKMHGKKAAGFAKGYATLEKSEAGEPFLYLELRAISLN
jgi:hypothetical protein